MEQSVRSKPALRSVLVSICLVVAFLKSGASGAAVAPTTTPVATTLVASTVAKAAAVTTKPTTPVVATTAKALLTTVKKAPPSTTAAATAATTQAKKPKRLCTFPFWHQGQWHHECLEYGNKGEHWCSLTQNFTRDEEWRECARYDLMRYKCAVPFHYNGKSYTQCQPLSLEPLPLPTFWCALVPGLARITWANLGTDWTFCEAPNATDAAYVKAVGPRKTLEAPGVATNAAVATNATVATQPPPQKPPAATTSVINVLAMVDAPKSLGASSDGASANDAAAGAGAASGLGVVLGIVGVLLAAVAVGAAFIVHRRNQYKRIDPLLSSEPLPEKSSYGGMQAYHD